MAQPYVITLSRDFASMGRTIAQLLSQRLGCAFYDRDIVEQTARRMGLPVFKNDDIRRNHGPSRASPACRYP